MFFCPRTTSHLLVAVTKPRRPSFSGFESDPDGSALFLRCVNKGFVKQDMWYAATKQLSKTFTLIKQRDVQFAIRRSTLARASRHRAVVHCDRPRPRPRPGGTATPDGSRCLGDWSDGAKHPSFHGASSTLFCTRETWRTARRVFDDRPHTCQHRRPGGRLVVLEPDRVRTGDQP